VVAALLAAPAAAASPAPPAASPSARGEAYYLYSLSQQALLRRDYAGAIRYLEASSRADPNASVLALELARAYLNLSEHDRALDEAGRAVALDPNGVEPRRLLVDAYQARLARDGLRGEEEFHRAVAAHMELLRADPSDGDSRLGLARLYLSRDLFLQAAEILKIHAASGPLTVETAYLLSQALLRSGSAGEAREVLEAALRLHPSQPDLRRSLGEALEADGDLEGAAAVFQELLAAFPDRHGHRLAAARLLLKGGRPAEAADHASQVVERLRGAAAGSAEEPDLRLAYVILIEALSATGDLARAAEAAEEAGRRIPQEGRFAVKRAELLLAAGRDAEAEAALARAAAGPDGRRTASEAYMRAGARLEREGKLERAEILLRRAIEADAGNHPAMNYLGYLNAERGLRLEEALDLVRRALDLEPGNGAYLDSLGWILFKLGRLAEAEEPLARAARLIPDEPVVHDHLGDLYAAQGRPGEAAASWREAIRLGAADARKIQDKIEKVEREHPPRE
jgi:tetratricopeptide (TPR) repeat protein